MQPKLLKLSDEQRNFIAENLAYLIKIKNTTENKVAEDLGIPVITLKRLLSGETTDPRIFTLKSIADYFKVSVDTLIGAITTTPYNFIGQSKPIFVPIFSWELAKDIRSIDLKQWKHWVPITIGQNEQISPHAFGLESKPSMYPRFQQGSIFIMDPELTPEDGDLVLVNIRADNELTLRELFIDPPVWQLNSLSPGTSSALKFSKDIYEIMAVVFLTFFYNRKMRTHPEI